MSASIDLCSRDNVKSYLGLSGATYDAVIDLLIPAASEAIERSCRQRFAETEREDYFDGGGLSRLVLQHRPVSSVASVWDDVNRDFAADTLLDESDYVVDLARGIILLRSGAFADGIRNVKVSYVTNYDAVPSDVAQACIMLTAAWFHRGREWADGLDARNVAEASQRFAQEPLPVSVQNLIQAYREHAI